MAAKAARSTALTGRRSNVTVAMPPSRSIRTVCMLRTILTPMGFNTRESYKGGMKDEVPIEYSPK